MIYTFTESTFTGLFSAGGQITGLIRMAAATDFTDPGFPGMRPGLGIKFLRSGTTSANFVVMMVSEVSDTRQSLLQLVYRLSGCQGNNINAYKF